MKQRISLITLGVADLARARAFYEAMGWQASPASQEGVVFFQAGGSALALFGRADLAKDAGVADEPTGFSALTLAYNTRTRDEVDAVYADALSAGASARKPPQEAFWGGYTAYVADPDGHLWEIAWNPFFTLDDAGNLHLQAP